MIRQKILVVEDDVKTADLIRRYLERESYHVLVAHDGRSALELARQRQPDLLVLDVMLPSLNGLEICRQLRAETNPLIIMLTAKSTETDKLEGLDLGADDYMTKPFSPRELVARVRAVLRRLAERPQPVPEWIRRGELLVYPQKHQAYLNGRELSLTPKEFRLLFLLANEPGRTFTRLELLELAFGLDYEGFERTVDVHILNLRKKIEENAAQPIYIQTVYGVGYKFAEPKDDVA